MTKSFDELTLADNFMFNKVMVAKITFNSVKFWNYNSVKFCSKILLFASRVFDKQKLADLFTKY